MRNVVERCTNDDNVDEGMFALLPLICKRKLYATNTTVCYNAPAINGLSTLNAIFLLRANPLALVGVEVV